MVKKQVQEEKKDSKLSCKLAKRVQYTSKKLLFDKEKLIKTIKLVKTQNLKFVKKSKQLFYNNMYAYISLKQPIDEKIKKPQVKLSDPIINSKNKLKICFVSGNKNEETEFKMMEALLKKEEFKPYNLKELIEVININSFMKMIKTYENVNELNYFYHQFIIENKYYGKIKKTLGNDINSLDIILFNTFSRNFEREAKLLSSSINCSKIVDVYRRKLFRIKVSNCSKSLPDIYKELKLNLFRIVAFLLSQSVKHNNVEYIVVKTENSIPISIYKEINPEELNYIHKEEKEERNDKEAEENHEEEENGEEMQNRFEMDAEELSN